MFHSPSYLPVAPITPARSHLVFSCTPPFLSTPPSSSYIVRFFLIVVYLRPFIYFPNVTRVVHSPILASSHLNRISCAASSIVLKPHAQDVETSSPNIELDQYSILLTHLFDHKSRPIPSFLFAFRCSQQLESDTLRKINGGVFVLI